MDTAVVGCFDPTVVVVRLKREFPDVVVSSEDLAWRDYDVFKQRGAVDHAVRIAQNDARRRGPIWAFRFPTSGGAPIKGRAERYNVQILSDEPIPEPLRSRFIAFLNELRFAPFVSVKSVNLDGNSESPA